MDISLIATAVFGVEAVVGRELKKLGYNDQKIENGRVHFKGDYEAICRSNLWLRSSERVLINMGEFTALTFDELFEKTKALPWEQWIPKDGEFPVSGKSINSKLFSVPDCQSIVKKAIVERLKSVYGNVSYFEETGPRYKIEVGLLKDVATLTIDTSGVGLHKRGYRRMTGDAPIKETLACAMLQISRWREDRTLFDPMCGIGTIPIEAAMIALNIAPGLKREFDFEHWPQIDKSYMKKAREEAHSLMELDREINIQGTDKDEKSLKLARIHLIEAGLEGRVHFQQRDLMEISSNDKYGFIVTNPPYGERLEDEKSIKRLYRNMGEKFAEFDTWSFYVITSFSRFEFEFGKMADKKRKLYNGRIQCNYYQFFGPKPPRSIK